MKNTLIIALTSICLTLTGCGATKNVAQEQKEANQRNELFVNSKASIDKLSQRFATAKQDNLAYFAADLYKDAINEMEDVNDEFDDIRFSPQNTTASIAAEIQSHVLKTNNLLDQAYLVKTSVDSVLAETNSQIERLKALDIERLYPKTYGKYAKTIDSMVKDIADGDVKEAQAEQAKLLPLLYALEGKAVKHIKLYSLQNALNKLKKSRVERVAPISYQKAVASIQFAESVITANPRAMDDIDASVDKVKLEIEHVKHIVLEIKSLAAVKTKNRETYILKQENQINKISQTLNMVDLRSYPLSKQYSKIAEHGEALITEKQQNKEQLTTLSAQLSNKEELINASSKDSKAAVQKLDEKLVYIGQLEQKLVNQKSAHQQALLAKENELLLIKNQLNQLQLNAAQNVVAPATSNQAEATPLNTAEKTQEESTAVEIAETIQEPSAPAPTVEDDSEEETTEPAASTTTNEAESPAVDTPPAA